MKKLLPLLLVVALLAPAPAHAFSIATPFKKTVAGLKYAGKKVGQGAEFAVVAFFGFLFCVSSGQCE